MNKESFARALGHIQLAIVSALLAVCGRRFARGSVIATFAAAACFILIYADSVARYSARIGGRLYFYICDDALISMRYARNLAEGRGLVYNAGEAVDGFTNPLWTAFMVLPHAAGLHEGVAPLPMMALGGLLLVLTGYLSRRVLASEGADATLQVTLPLLAMFDASIFEFSVVGLETPLLGAGVALVMAGTLLTRRVWVWVGLVTLTLARADGAVVAALMLTWIVLEDRATSHEPWSIVLRRHATECMVFVATTTALVSWRMALYGYPAPNTYYLKVYSLATRVETGVLSYGVRGVLMYGLPVAFVGLVGGATPLAQRARRLLLPVIGVWLYAVYVGGDAFSHMRFLGPVTPMVWTAVGLTVASGWSQRTERGNALIIPLVAVFVPIVSERGVLGSTWDRSEWIRQVVVAAKTVAANVPPDAEIATFYAGVPYYAPSRRFVDVLGKTERHIAHDTQIHGAIPGHNKFDFRWVYDQRRPAVTFTALSCDDVDRNIGHGPEDIEKLRETVGRHAFQAPWAQVADDRFRELYYPQRVVLRDGEKPAGHPIGCWFIRQGADVPIVWQVAER